MRSTLLTACLSGTWKLLEDRGYPPAALFTEAGIDPDALQRPDGRIQFDRAIKLWESVDALFKDPCLGIEFPKYWHPSHYQALGCAWISSKTLREALGRLHRYAKIISETLIIHLSEGADDLSVEVDFVHPFSSAIHRLVMTATLANLVLMSRINYGRNLNPKRVSFKHARPACAGDYFFFFKTDVVFGAEKDAVAFSGEVLDKALVGLNPQMAQHADKVALEYLAKLDKSDIVSRVNAQIVEMMPSGEATAGKVSRKLAMSERSLGRKLQEKGTSFRELLNKTRKEMASHYLKEARVELVEIPYLLGYTDYTAFFKAYKRWTGQSPTGIARPSVSA